MGKIIKSSFKKIIVKLFQILGISSLLTSFGACNFKPQEEIIYGPVMYGVPGNFFTFEGTVTDEDGNAIKGIELNAKAKADIPSNENEEDNDNDNDNDDDDDDSKHKSFYVYCTPETTSEDGSFSLYWNDYDRDNLDFTIYIKDIDGEENGSFNDTTYDVTFKQSNFTGKSDFGNGKYKITGKTIKLTKMSDTDN